MVTLLTILMGLIKDSTLTKVRTAKTFDEKKLSADVTNVVYTALSIGLVTGNFITDGDGNLQDVHEYIFPQNLIDIANSQRLFLRSSHVDRSHPIYVFSSAKDELGENGAKVVSPDTVKRVLADLKSMMYDKDVSVSLGTPQAYTFEARTIADVGGIMYDDEYYPIKDGALIDPEIVAILNMNILGSIDGENLQYSGIPSVYPAVERAKYILSGKGQNTNE